MKNEGTASVDVDNLADVELMDGCWCYVLLVIDSSSRERMEETGDNEVGSANAEYVADS